MTEVVAQPLHATFFARPAVEEGKITPLTA